MPHEDINAPSEETKKDGTLTEEESKAEAVRWQQRVDDVKQGRKLWEAKVATVAMFVAGKHTVSWDQNGMLREKFLREHEVFRTLNLFPVALSIIQSRLLTNDPRWNPRKSELENVSEEEVDAADAYLQNMWEGEDNGEYGIKRRLKQVIRKGWMQGGAITYYRWDDDTESPVMDVFSLWDSYFDTSSRGFCNKRWVCFPVPMSIEGLKAMAKDDDTFDKEMVSDLVADNKLAESIFQTQYLKRVQGVTQPKKGTVIVNQTFEIVDDHIVHQLIGPKGVLKKVDLPYKKLSEIFDMFTPVEDDDSYPIPPCYDWVDPQKSVNSAFSGIENYIGMFLQGKWLLRDERVTKPFGGVMGQFAIGEPGDITQLPLNPLPNTHFNHFQNAISQFEQITGVHSESLGRQSGSADSGVAIAQLQALDSQNSADAVDNFKLFLKRTASKLLCIASANWSRTRDIYRYDKKTGAEDKFSVIGESAYSARTGSVSKDITKLRPFKRLDVEIVVGQFFSSVEKMEQLTQLLQVYQPGANPAQDQFILPLVLETFNIGVGRDFVKELRKLRNPQILIAEGKVQLIMEGEPVPVNIEDPHEFLQQYYADKSKVALEQGDQKGAAALASQAQIHAVMASQQGQGVPLPEEPLSLEESALAPAPGALPLSEV